MSAAEPILVLEHVDAFYGSAQALEDVSLEVGSGATSVVGRNGMGKTTLCNAILGIPPARVRGSIRYRGAELVGRPSYKIAKLGIGYVPQGRRLFPSLSVDEHLRMISRRGRPARWTPAKVYELFPRLAERKRNGGGQLSGGEQQMLAIGRALLTNPSLLVMDEPSEGLAPTVIEQLIETFSDARAGGARDPADRAEPRSRDRRRRAAGGDGLGRGSQPRRPRRSLSSDTELQRRYLGVEPLAESGLSGARRSRSARSTRRAASTRICASGCSSTAST